MLKFFILEISTFFSHFSLFATPLNKGHNLLLDATPWNQLISASLVNTTWLDPCSLFLLILLMNLGSFSWLLIYYMTILQRTYDAKIKMWVLKLFSKKNGCIVPTWVKAAGSGVKYWFNIKSKIRNFSKKEQLNRFHAKVQPRSLENGHFITHFTGKGHY